MEVECALRLWGRSEMEHKLQYTTILCNVDSKAYAAIVRNQIDGPSKCVVKEERINHVSKRMGTAWRNLIATSKAQNDSITGKGKLTQKKVLKIQNYYGRAIKDYCNDTSLLKKIIFAILFHLTSSNDHPKNMHCTPGTNSWCFWHRAIVASKYPGAHKEHDTLPSEIGRKLAPIFQRLTEENLLKRCARNKTQNENESFHSTTWIYCPKSVFVGRKTMDTAVLQCATFEWDHHSATIVHGYGLKSPHQNIPHKKSSLQSKKE